MMDERKIIEIRDLKKGRYAVIDDEACKVSDLIRSKPGKHGEAKVRIEGIGLFDNRKRSIIKPAGHKITVPVINKVIAQVVSIVHDQVQLMDMETYEIFELPMPEDISGLSEGVEVLCLQTMGRRKILEVKR